MSEKLETYYNHYKETYALSKAAQDRRNKNFVVLCFLEALSFLMIKNPEFICSMLNDAVRKHLESTIWFSNSILQTLIWFLIAYVLIRYVQDSLYVERQYYYLDLLEKKIAKLLDESERDIIFSREGQYYQKGYPIVLNLIDLFYKLLAPILFTIINLFHIILEWHNNELQFSLICDVIVCVVIILVTWFYFFEIHNKLSDWFKRCSAIRLAANLLRKWLKEV